MGEVEGLALGNERSNLRPGLGLGGIGKQVHDDGSSVDGLLDGEKSLSGNPSVLNSLLPAGRKKKGAVGFRESKVSEQEKLHLRLSILSDSDNHVDTVVSGVKTLSVTLGSVTDEGKGVVLEVPLNRRGKARKVSAWTKEHFEKARELQGKKPRAKKNDAVVEKKKKKKEAGISKKERKKKKTRTPGAWEGASQIARRRSPWFRQSQGS